MSDKTFVDTNILVYAHDADGGSKRQRAIEALHHLWETRSGVVSPQVLQEFYVSVTRKIASQLPKSSARNIVQAYAPWCIDVSAHDVATAFRIEDEAKINFWDALIVSAAVKSGAVRIFSEDLNGGQIIAGVRIENPLVQVRRRR